MTAVRRLVRVLVITAAVLIGTLAVALVTTQTAWFKDWLRRYVIRQADEYLNAELRIDRLAGNLLTGLELQNMQVIQDGETIIAVKDVGLDYNVLDIVSQGLVIDSLRLNEPRIALRRTNDGWNIARLVKEQRQEARREGPGRTVEVAAIDITNGLVTIDGQADEAAAVRLPRRIERIDARGAFAYAPVHFSVELAEVSMRAIGPDLVLDHLSGHVSVREDEIFVDDLALRTAESSVSVEGSVRDYLATPRLDMVVSSDRFTPRELAGFVPALDGVTVRPAFEVRTAGTLRDLQVEADVRTGAGSLTARVRGDLQSDTRTLEGKIRVEDLDAGALLSRPELGSDVTADATFDLRGSGPDDLHGEVQIESGPVRAAGYALDSLRADATLKGRAIDLRARGRGYGSVLTAGGSLTRPASPEDPLTYDFRGRLASVNLRRLPLPERAPRLATNLNGTYHVRGAGDRLVATLRLNSSTAEGAAIADGTTARVDLSGRVPTYAARGGFSDLDPQRLARALGRPALADDRWAGRVNARFDLEGRGTTLENVEARADVQVQDSRLGGVDVPLLAVRGTVADQLARVETLRLQSTAAIVDASGVVALRDDMESALTYQAEATDLGAVGALAGAPDMAGTARLEGTVTGTRARLRTEGTLSASNVRYATTTAMSVSSRYGIELPDLDLQRLRAEADTVATLLEVGGREIREVTAQTTYAAPELTFDTTISEADRSVEARGQAAFAPDVQEVRLEHLTLRTGDVAWATPPDSLSTFRYTEGRVAVDRFALVNGDQRIEVGGAVDLGEEAVGAAVQQAEGALKITAQNVDISQVDDLTVGDRSVGGRLEAAVTFAGSLQAPTLEGTVSVDEGFFRDFRFEQLDTTVAYDRRGATLDLRLQQSPDVWLTAQGTVPAAAPGAQAQAPAQEHPLDVRVQSSPISLGLLQGFTTAVKDATGTLTADVRVTGAVQAPRLDGQVAIAQGGFTLVPTEATYQQLEGLVRLAGDRITIERFQVLDSGEEPLTLSGGVTLRDNRVGEMDVRARAAGFRVAENRLADLQVDLDLHATGAPLSPFVQGEIAVHDGRLEVDRILELFQTGLYSTEGIEAATEPVAESSAGQEQPTTFNAVTFDVRLRVPDNLVLRGDDIRPGGRGISLGDMNVTLGGDLTAVRTSTEPLRVSGKVRTVRGYYEFQGRRFDVERDGTISFAGPDPTDPLVDVTATRDIEGVEASVHIGGSVQRPTLTLASTPPLEDADILALIVFNRPLNDLGQGERASLSQQAQSLAGGMVAAPLAESLRDALDVDMLDIQAVAPEGDGPSVTVGNQLGERVFLQFRQLFGSAQATEVLLEYELMEALRLQTSFTEGATDDQAAGGKQERAGVDLIFTVEP